MRVLDELCTVVHKAASYDKSRYKKTEMGSITKVGVFWIFFKSTSSRKKKSLGTFQGSS